MLLKEEKAKLVLTVERKATARDKDCPARGKRCAKCGKDGHFAACCKGEKEDYKPWRPTVRQCHGPNHDQRTSGQQANYVEDVVDEDDMCSFSFSITEQAYSVSASAEPVISVSINGISREMLIDSGSVSNLIRKEIFQELSCQGLKAELQHCSKKL